jgi:hypothetical protein
MVILKERVKKTSDIDEDAEVTYGVSMEHP